MRLPGIVGPRKMVLRIVGLGAGALLLAVCLGLFWPPPRGAEPLRCGPSDGSNCEAVSGRVLYALSKDRTDASRSLHLVLLSRQSSAFPLVSVVKIPVHLRPGKTPGLGRWISAVGPAHEGSNGQTNVGVTRVLIP